MSDRGLFLRLVVRVSWWVCLAGLTAFAGHADSASSAVPAFPPSLQSYQDSQLAGTWEVLQHRVRVEPFNLVVTLVFLAAVVHTFFCHKFRHWAHVLEERQRARGPAGAPPPPAGAGGALPRLLHFFGEVEVVFGIWVIPLALLMAWRFGRETAIDYVGHRVNFNEPLFVVVILVMCATRPVLVLAEQCLSAVARLGGESVAAWWMSILTVGPILGSLITEPAAMTISALLLAKQFYAWKPRPALAYATLGLLFVNVSVGGTLTHFAAPPVLMVAEPWGWGASHMVLHFGWKVILVVGAANAVYGFAFRKDFRALESARAAANGVAAKDRDAAPAIPLWVTAGHLLFMAAAVLAAHQPIILIGALLFFLAFYEVTQDCQTELQLRPAILVGFFLTGLVVHGGLQQWWIAPVLGRLTEVPLMVGAVALTAFNDNAAITYLASLVPNLSEPLRYAVVAGAVTGGGLTVIANAPNPAGQAILNRFFPDGIAPLGLFLGALGPTILNAACFLLFR